MNKRGSVLLSILIGVLAASLLGLTTDQIMQRVYVPIDATTGSMRVSLTGGVAATSISSGVTTITGGTVGSPCYDATGGVIDCADTGWAFNGTTNAFRATGTITSGVAGSATGGFLAAGATSGAVSILPQAAAGTYNFNLPTSAGTTGQPLLSGGGGAGAQTYGTLGIGGGGTGAASLTGSRCLQTNAGGTAIEVAAAVCGTGAGTVTGTGTAGLMPIWSTTTALGDSNAFPILVANEGATGTTVNKLAKFTSAGTAIITSAAETAGILGVVKGGAGTTGSAQIITIGGATCISDNATTAGHYAIVSASTAGSCSNSGSSTFPAAGTQVIGVWSESGIAGARTLFFGTPDVASASSGGGGGGAKNPAGAAGDVQYRATGNNFAAEAAFNYDAANNRHLWSGLTSANDNATKMFSLSGTMPTTPTSFVTGSTWAITGAGSASQANTAFFLNYAAGYTGSSNTEAMNILNANEGTGTTLSLSSSSAVAGNTGLRVAAGPNSSGGQGLGLSAEGRQQGGNGIGVYTRSYSSGTGTNIGILANASGSGNGTNLKNVPIYGTLNSSLITGSNIDAVQINDNGGIAASMLRLYDNKVLMFDVADVSGTAVNGLSVTGGATTVGPTLAAIGETNVPITLAAKGTGAVNITAGSSGIIHTGAATFNSTVTSSATGSLGWSVVAVANQACNTTCTSACVVGFDLVAGIGDCASALSDQCLCAGAS